MTWPVGYVVTVAIAGWLTFCAVIGPRRPFLLGRLSWLSAMVVNEVPFLAMYLLIASTVLAAAEGDLNSWGGRIAAAAAVVVLAGLAVAAWRGVRSDRVVRAALAQGLGAHWRDRVDAPLRLRRPWARILLIPFVHSQHGVERLRDIPYSDGGRRNLLDLYRRVDCPPDAPVLIYFHGGGFRSGKKSHEARPLLTQLASQGWVCLSANYRLHPQVTFPEHQIDAKKVIAWAREHAGEYGIDPSKLFVSGSSAGANMAGLCAFTPNDPSFQPGFESADTSVTGAILLYGYYGRFFGDEPDEPPSVQQPQGYFDGETPPLFIAHGTNDSWGTVEGARHFVSRLRENGRNTIVYAELPGGQHSFDVFHSPRFEAVVDGVAAFTAWTIANNVDA